MPVISENASAANPPEQSLATDSLIRSERGQHWWGGAKGESNFLLFPDHSLPGNSPEFLALSAERVDQVGVILRAHHEVLIQHANVDGMEYVTGRFADLHFEAIDCLARAICSMLPVALAIKKSDVQFRTGHLFNKNRLCAASQFMLSEEKRQLIDDESFIMGIHRCVELLKDAQLWEYKQPGGSEDSDASWKLIEAARIARQEVPGKHLRFASSVSSPEAKTTLQITPNLAPAKPRVTQEKLAHAPGVLTGYCTHDRYVRFLADGLRAPTNIGFDEEQFFDLICKYAGKNRYRIQLDWVEVLADGVVTHRTLKSIHSLIAPLF